MSVVPPVLDLALTSIFETTSDISSTSAVLENQSINHAALVLTQRAIVEIWLEVLRVSFGALLRCPCSDQMGDLAPIANPIRC